MNEEALDRTNLRTRFGRSYGPVVRQTAWWWCKSAWEIKIQGCFKGF